MVWEFVLGFVVLVAASYVGTTMALRGFFGREYYDQSASSRPGGGDSGREGSDHEGFGRGESGHEESSRKGIGREGSAREGSGADTPSEADTRSETGNRPDKE